MESKEYFEKVMQDFNQNRNGRSMSKYLPPRLARLNSLKK